MDVVILVNIYFCTLEETTATASPDFEKCFFYGKLPRIRKIKIKGAGSETACKVIFVDFYFNVYKKKLYFSHRIINSFPQIKNVQL